MDTKSLLELALRERAILTNPQLKQQLEQRILSSLPAGNVAKSGGLLKDAVSRMDIERMLARLGANISEKGILAGSPTVEQVGVQLLGRGARGLK